MNKICAWCRRPLPSAVNGNSIGNGNGNSPASSPEPPVTHGICETCAGEHFGSPGQSLTEFLDTLELPVLVVNEAGLVQLANTPARRMLGKDPGQIAGRPGGDVFECVFAALPAGCGHTLHCKGCVIRRTVMGTMETGQPQHRVPATQRLRTEGGVRAIDFHISTERVADFVLLRIDEAAPA
jgi:PAS domain-containing protein